MSFDLFLYNRVEELNRSNLFPIPDFREFLEGQVPRLPTRSRCKEQHPGGCSIFQIPRKSQKSNIFCDFSGRWRTSCYRLQHHCYIDLASATIVGEGNIQDSHRVFVQEVCSNWVKGKRPSKFQSQVFIWSNSTNQILFAFMRWRKYLILSNPKLCEQYLEESKFAGREHRCQNHNPGFHMCTQTFAGKKETTHANGGDNNKTETMHLWTGRGVWLVLESPEALDSSHGQSASWSRCQKYSTCRKNATKLQGSPNPLRSISAAPLLPPKILLSEKKTKSKSQTQYPTIQKKKALRLNNIHTHYSSPNTQEKNPKTPPPSKESNCN